MSKKLIPAVAYLRKSTNRTLEDGRHTQENSLPRQKQEIEKLAEREGYDIKRWYGDPGVSGWKREVKRPEFNKMLNDAREKRDFKAIIVDDANRFTRSTWRKAVIDIDGLAEAGVERIISAKEGVFHIADENDPGEAHRLIAIAMGNHQFCRTLSRAVLLGLNMRAKEGKRSGGRVPYGMAGVYEMEGGRNKLTYLKHGDRKQLAVVRRIYNRFIDPSCPSLNSIVSDLNGEGIPSPRGKQWTVAGIKDLLMRPCYRGDFTYGRKQEGVFYTTAKDGNVVEVKNEPVPWRYGEPTVRVKKAHTPVIPPEVWDEAQRRLAQLGLKGSRRPRKDGYPLAGILICGHCGKAMYGCQPTGRKYRVYRCSTPAKTGMGTCGMYEIREELILPQVLEMLAEEINDIRTLLTAPPVDVAIPRPNRDSEREARQHEIDEVQGAINVAEDNILRVTDKRQLVSLTAKVSKLYDKLAQLKTESAPAEQLEYNIEEWQAFDHWWASLFSRCVKVPAKGTKADCLYFRSNVDVWSVSAHGEIVGLDESDKVVSEERVYALVDARVANEALHSLGAEVRLRWRTTSVTLRGGRKQNRYSLIGGRFRLGQQTGKLANKNGVILHKVPAEEPCNGIHVADRCDNHTGKD